jgi:RNA polymerase sigma-70 factor (ECF subfamily)
MASDDKDVGAPPGFEPDPGLGLLELYDEALPQVYGYLLPRCGNAAVAEDLTAESFLAAVAAVRKPGAQPPSVPWLIGVARHKLVDHWRRSAREERNLRAVEQEAAPPEDPWDARLDAMRAREVLGQLGPHHRVALTLRYADGLPVPEVAEVLGRTVHATEALLVRARQAFRRQYMSGEATS